MWRHPARRWHSALKRWQQGAFAAPCWYWALMELMCPPVPTVRGSAKNEEQLGDALKQVKEAGLIPEDQVRLCVVCDGASWIWKHVESLFPSARQVLDYYHCKEYLHKVAKVQYDSPERALEWVEATLTRLYLGKVGWVLSGLRRMP